MPRCVIINCNSTKISNTQRQEHISNHRATNVFKGCVAAMIYVTHALNFWPPFNLVFYYLKKRHDPTKALKWELIYRAIIVTCIAFIAIVFPSIDNLMGFLGTFCLSNMAFIWPNVITILVIYERPGYGKYKWRLWRCLIFIVIGVFLWICGSIVNTTELVKKFLDMFGKNKDTATTTSAPEL